eukprot:gene37099-45768_t
MVKAIFVLKHDAFAIQKFEKKLLGISTPKSATYGKFLKPEEIANDIAPSEKNLKIVTDYLATFGVTGRVSQFRDLVHVTMPVKVANAMLNTEFALFRSVTERDVVIPRITKPYSLPSEVASVVSLVDDILRFPALRNSPTSYGVDESVGTDDEFSSCGRSCNGDTTPAVLQKAYSFSAVTTVADGNSMSVAEFQSQYWDQADLTAFNSACGSTASVTTTIGGNNERICTAGGCTEALLDIEYIGAVAAPIPLTVWYSSTYSLLDWVDSIMAATPLVWVHSLSYGNDEVQQTSDEYMQSTNVQFMAAGSLGLSLLAASGDQGVWGRSGKGKVFHPDYPASSPYITSVGGTDFATKSVIGAETTWDCGGGGFSDAFAQPSWQTAAVTAYFTAANAAGKIPESSYYNATGRGYPDVSALGGQVNPYCVSVKGGAKFKGVAGTSASCPVVAGIFAQLNNDRLLANGNVLGWLNPFLYENAQGTTGFYALDGWDAATGLGTPNYTCLKSVL